MGKNKRDPIYERLAPGEVLIIARYEDGSFEVAENREQVHSGIKGL